MAMKLSVQNDLVQTRKSSIATTLVRKWCLNTKFNLLQDPPPVWPNHICRCYMTQYVLMFLSSNYCNFPLTNQGSSNTELAQHCLHVTSVIRYNFSV